MTMQCPRPSRLHRVRAELLTVSMQLRWASALQDYCSCTGRRSGPEPCCFKLTLGVLPWVTGALRLHKLVLGA